MKSFLFISLALILSACAQPEPLCDRDAVSFNKFGKVIDTCAGSVVPTKTGDLPDFHVDDDTDDHGNDNDRPSTPDQPGPPKKDEPSDSTNDSTDNVTDESESSGNPGNHKDVGKAGERPNKKDGWGSGDKGRSS